MTTSKKFLKSDIYNIDYQDDLTKCFTNLCFDKKNTILLESAEIDTKDKLKSLFVVNSAVRISCIDNQVVLKALSQNGELALKSITNHINDKVAHKLEDGQLILSFKDSIDSQLDEYKKLKQASIFDALRYIKGTFEVDNPFSVFIAGLFAYDVVGNFENIGTVKRKNKCPDYVFYLAETILISDHKDKKTYIQTNCFSEKNASELADDITNIKSNIDKNFTTKIDKFKNLEPKVSVNDKDFCATVDYLKSHIINGDIFQVVPSRTFSLPCQNSVEVYKELKRTNPSPYMFYMQDEDFILFGASPESALKYESATNQVEIYPIAGTRRRGKNADGTIDYDLDSRIELELRLDGKENAEHMMLVDLARNDIARIAKRGTRYLADLLKVDRYSHVMHLVSRVVGQLDDGLGDLDSCIVIRSAYVENEIAEIQAGAGVVLDSIPIAEADETRTKAQAVISAIKNVHGE